MWDLRDRLEHVTPADYHQGVSQHARVGPNIGRSVLRHPLLVLIVTAAFAAAGYYWSSQQNEQFTATTRLFLSSSSPFDGVGSRDFVNNPDRYAVNQAAIALSQPVLSRAIEDGDLSVDVQRLRSALTISAGRGTDVIVIEATAPSGGQAESWANSVAQAYRSFMADEVDQQTQELLALSATEADSASVLKRAAVYGDGIALVEEAVSPTEPSYPQPTRDGLIAAIVGLVLGIAAAVVIDVISGARTRRRALDRQKARSGLRSWWRRVRTNPHEVGEDESEVAGAPKQTLKTADSTTYGEPAGGIIGGDGSPERDPRRAKEPIG